MQITDFTHQFLKPYIRKDAVLVDATAGRGKDTLFLCRQIGPLGQVYAFDIQQEAILATQTLLEQERQLQKATLILDGHEHMDKYLKDISVDAVVFNLGYLPGGSHQIQTRPQTTIAAVCQALKLLKLGGIVSICIYSGKDSGFTEQEALLAYLKEVDAHKYTVILNHFYNKPNCPPMPCFIIRESV